MQLSIQKRYAFKMSLSDKLKLFVLGKPIRKDYSFWLTEKEFMDKAKLYIVIGKEPKYFSAPKERFFSESNLESNKEIIIRISKSLWRKNSISNTILIEAKIKPISERKLIFETTIKRTFYMKFGLLIISLCYLLFLIPIIVRSNWEMNFDLVLICLLLFIPSFIGYLISFIQMHKQIVYFERNLISELEK